MEIEVVMVPPNIWHALRQTAIICLLAIGLGIGFALVTCSTGCAWSPTAKQQRYAAYATEATALGALACDGHSTAQFRSEARYTETNPILGTYPSVGDVWLYIGAVGAAVIATNVIAASEGNTHPRARIAINAAVAALEIASSWHNSSVGASPCGIGAGGPWGDMNEHAGRIEEHR
jgi:hypothetical protein